MQERLQKILSARGICSRRKAEEFIEKGLIKVNGKVAELGQKADPEKDKIEVDGEVIESRKDLVYYVINKPRGIITTNAERKNQETIISLLPKKLQGKIFPVGRLDKESSGLLLLTNDGVLAYRLTHPKFDHEKEYEVITVREITDGALNKLKKGMTISGSKTKPAKIKRISQTKFTIALTEGKNRQIRRMCQKVGCPVKELKRIRIMTLEDARLKEGEVRELSKKEKADLLESVGL
ncbi:MAG: pseudouridine synthase [Candidatus Peribacteraceae bacterium]|jgi:23S rRNA pseudouridine2605 synthase/23S rRNA pseudouridine2604 synthase|nr:pseudouridine synthase [Candidatus Peribacteraceae bacterium]HCI04224.1 rRNA pseudouridine synthase [Candidatus Peribacteria bacterium]|tara:strand:+ start:3868 stop:4578 length:711 start_codon:yes stop_codon:yes gene_type:complete